MPTAADSTESLSESLPAQRIEWKPVLLAVVLLVAACLLTFGQVVTHRFVLWDDPINITDNPYLNPPTEEGMRQLWGSSYAGLYSPVAYSWWAGLITISHSTIHAGNLLLHILAVLVVFAILRRLVVSVPGAFFGALLFAVHPLQAESVNWASEARGLLAALFGLIALWLYLRVTEMEYEIPPVEEDTASEAKKTAHESKDAENDASENAEEEEEYVEDDDLPPIPVGRYIVYTLATLAFVIAMLSKPSAATIPLIAWVLDFAWLGRRPKGHPEVWSDWSLLAVWALITAGVAYGTSSFQAGMGDIQGEVWWVRPLVAGDALYFYLYKLFLPLQFCTDYGRTPTFVVKQWWGYLTWFVPALLLALLWRLEKPQPWLIAVAVAVLSVLPVLGLIPFGFQFYSTVADRYMYLAMLGPALAIAWLVQTADRKPLRYGLIVALCILAAISFRQCTFWKNNDRLFQHTLDVNPRSFMAYSNLGTERLANKEYEESERYFQAALDIAPQHLETLISMGLLLREKGDLRRALPYLREAVEINPNAAPALDGLGMAYHDQGRFDEAELLLRRAVECDPHYYHARVSLGELLVAQGKYPQAIDQYVEARNIRQGLIAANFGIAEAMIEQMSEEGAAPNREAVDKVIDLLQEVYQVDPEYPRARELLAISHRLLATILKAEQRFAAAEEQLLLAVELDSESIELLSELATVYFIEGKYDEAEATLRTILQIDKRNIEARIGLGNLMATQGKSEAALAEYESILAINPDYPGAYYQIGFVMQGEGRFSEAVEAYRSALNYRETWNGWHVAANNMAWILATVNDPVVRNGQEALEWATELVDSFTDELPPDYIEYLDTLAAAHAELGQFDEAVSVTRRALAMANQRQDPDLAARFQRRLELYFTDRTLNEANQGVDSEVQAARANDDQQTEESPAADDAAATSEES